MAIIDADRRSPHYGKVVNTAALEAVPNANLLDELGMASRIASDVLNEAHHMNHDPITVYERRYLFPAGLMSANILLCDVTDPLHIPTCPLVTTSTQVKKFAGIGDIVQLPNNNLLVTYLGAKDLTTPGGLVEIDVEGNVIHEYDATEPGGPIRYVPSVKGVTDAGLLAHPHGMDIRPDLGVVATSDYADPSTIAANTVSWNPDQDLGTTVRVWDVSHLDAGPQKIGPRVRASKATRCKKNQKV
jgi:56kDa selenium binding protein (SBP56)